MPYQLNTAIPVSHGTNNTNYLISQKHRGAATASISVWDVSLDDEVGCFTRSFRNGWNTNSNAWGCISIGQRELGRIGYNLKNNMLIIAKFVCDQDQWHGYPADLKNKPNDKPVPSVLFSWYQQQIISKMLMSRIKQGQI